MFDYETLKIIWWVLIGVLFIGFALTDGFDMGVGIMLKIVGKNDTQRRVMINTVAPHWDGNQVWFVLAGGALFAAWPAVYATAFSGFYFAMMLVLFALFFRPVGFDYRSKLDDPRWRSYWDWALTAGSGIPPLVFGVAMGNLILGVPFHFDEFQRPFYDGSFFALFHPFALLTGLMAVSMLVTHGATWLMLRTEGEIYERSRQAAFISSIALTVLFALGGIWLTAGIDGYVITSDLDPSGPANPLLKTAEIQAGAWLNNYRDYPLTMLAPIVGFIGSIGVILFAKMSRAGFASLSSTLAIVGIILTAGVTMFPFVMPSSTDPSHSLTAYDSVSSRLTLEIMFWVSAFFVPLIIGYTTWCYKAMWGHVTEEHVEKNSHSLY